MLDKSISGFQKSLEISPDLAGTHLMLGETFAKQGNSEEAVKHFNESIRTEPNNARAYKNLGTAMMSLGKPEEAITSFKEAIQKDPDFEGIYAYLGNALSFQGRQEEAVEALNKALQVQPENPGIYNELGIAFIRQGKVVETITHFKKALQAKPDWILTMNNLAWILATYEEVWLRDPDEAVRLAKRACILTDFKRPNLLDTLAAAYAAAGRFPDALSTVKKAVEMAQSSGHMELAEEIKERMSLYKSGKAYKESLSVLMQSYSAI
jgi:superkiller protein 3